MSDRELNVDAATVCGFGAEWRTFDQRAVNDEELRRTFSAYFRIFPWERLREGSIGIDVGCGSGRWARFVAPRVGALHCVDASAEALDIARRALAGQLNCSFHRASVAELPFEAGSMDFGYALGVLHHVPDAAAALRSCIQPLRPGAPLLIYMYYALDNRSAPYRLLWRTSDLLRRVVSRLPHGAKLATSTMIALLVYWPLARGARLVDRLGGCADSVPLGFYRDRSLYTMRTDAYDRFGTRLERRFTAAEVRSLMENAGLGEVRLSTEPPFWCAVGVRR